MVSSTPPVIRQFGNLDGSHASQIKTTGNANETRVSVSGRAQASTTILSEWQAGEPHQMAICKDPPSGTSAGAATQAYSPKIAYRCASQTNAITLILVASL
jgi:hypothetical protein